MQFSTSAPPTQRRSSTVASEQELSGEPLLSVIVPTRDRPRALEACLAALAAQTVSRRAEVIVVDDGSIDEDDVAATVSRHLRSRLVRQPAAGPAAARNAGVAAARADMLCFIDDDCVAEPEWAERLADAIVHGADVVAGKTLSEGTRLADAAEFIAMAPARVQPFAPSNNLACRRHVLESVPFAGSFREAAAEDRDWCARVAAAGFELVRRPDARVVHRQELTLAKFIRRQLRYGRGAYQFRADSRGKARLEAPSFYVTLLRDAFAEGPMVGALVAAAQVVTAAGFIGASSASRRSAQSPPAAQTRPR
jgi:glycosyltransferase involved in cell wall biosynthesis